MKVPFFRTPYNYDVDQASVESGLSCADPSRTDQSFVEECDINTIVSRFGLTGELPIGLVAPTFADFDDVIDFHTAAVAVKRAQESFMLMPAEVRSRFENDPQKFVAFCSDEGNRDEMRKLGLLRPEAVVPPTPQASAASTVGKVDSSAGDSA